MIDTEWISCDDRLPSLHDQFPYVSESDRVLVFANNKQYVGYLYQLEPDQLPEWRQDGRDFYGIENATHWQPLPTPPKTVPTGRA